MKIHMSRRLFLPAAVLGGVAVFAAVFFVALAVHSVVADPGGPVPNPGHAWTEIQDHGIDGGDYWLGTIDMQALELRVNGSRALRLEPTDDTPNIIGGYSGNSVTDGAYGATIGGGGGIGSANRVTDGFGTVSGGLDNLAGDDAGLPDDQEHATVAGGGYNTAGARNATVGGGYSNTADGESATVGGGDTNSASGMSATVAGGGGNTASGIEATVGGGRWNTASNGWATVGGGENNTAGWSWATVSGGLNNTASDDHATVGGGDNNAATSTNATVGGGAINTASGHAATVSGGEGVTASGNYATVSGGGRTDPFDPATGNRVTDDYGTIGGGGNNQAGDAAESPDDAPYNTVSGGEGNVASASLWGSQAGRWWGHATVGGGQWNTASNLWATVGGGGANTASGDSATVAGGDNNTASAAFATVGGGHNNQATASCATISGGCRSDPEDGSTANLVTDDYGTIGGGGNNLAGDDDPDSGNSPYATVGGGESNIATNMNATVGGGHQNAASGYAATVPGGDGNTAAGTLSFAAGLSAKADHEGAFVWGDHNDFEFHSTAANEFSARTTGGARFVLAIDGSGAPTWTCSVSNGGTWSCSSDRSLKENLVAADGDDILESLSGVPVFSWSAKGQDPAVRHIGPMAQDFYAAFGVGEDDGQLATIDLDGVALAAIQGLYELAQDQDAQIAAQQQRIDDLEARVAALEGGSEASNGSSGPLSSSLTAGGLLFGALFLGGLVLVQRRRAGGRS